MGEGGTCFLYGFPSVSERCPSTPGSNRLQPTNMAFPLSDSRPRASLTVLTISSTPQSPASN